MVLMSSGQGYHRFIHNTKVIEVKPKNRPSEEALAFLLLNYEITYTTSFDNEDLSSEIKISYCKIHPGYYRRSSQSNLFFKGEYNKYKNSVSLTGRAVFLDLPGLEGQKIGSYLMNEIVAWAKRWPNAQIETIKLYENQASTDNKERRNRFYEQFGIEFDYVDENRKSGYSLPILVNDLKNIDSWKRNIIEYSTPDFLCRLMNYNYDLLSKQDKNKSEIDYLNKEIKRAEKNPFIWACIYNIRKYKSFVILTSITCFFIFIYIKSINS